MIAWRGERRALLKALCLATAAVGGALSAPALQSKAGELDLPRQKGIAVLIGVSHYSRSPLVQGDTDTDLIHPIKDVEGIRQLLASSPTIDTHVFVDSKATRQNVLSAITSAADTLKSGELLVIYFSGHGIELDVCKTWMLEDIVAIKNRMDARNAAIFEADDSRLNAWCLWDGLLFDLELLNQWHNFREGVEILLVVDCCHAQESFKGDAILKTLDRVAYGVNFSFAKSSLAPVTIRKVDVKSIGAQLIEKGAGSNLLRESVLHLKDYEKLNLDEESINASLIELAACSKGEKAVAFSSDAYSVFTLGLINAVKLKAPNYHALFRAAEAEVKRFQSPTFRMFPISRGPECLEFAQRCPPFSLSDAVGR